MSAGPAAQVAFDRAVADVTGLDPGDHGVHMSGKTDPQIALEILAALAIEGEEAQRDLPEILRHLEKEVEAAITQMRRDGRIHPGAMAVVRRLHGAPDVVQTLLTGNLEANAFVKVSLFGLEPFFDFEVGAYGSDDPDRDRLIPVAMDKLRRVRDQTVAPGDVWVVGDTPRDLDCARAGGARCLLVGTGRYGFDALKDLTADAVLPDLSDTEAVVGILLS